MVLLEFKGKNNLIYFIRSDSIIYYSYDPEKNTTTIFSNPGWFHVEGDVTKEITTEIKKTETTRVIPIGV